MIQKQAIDAIRVLGIDGINKANSGHPGIVLGAAPMTYTLFTKQLRVNPSVSEWVNRDRFVLAAGHGSMLLYTMLHLSGFNVSIDDIKDFRQLGSKTPGHPEYGHTEGVDSTSGPLGQGIPTAMGMAMAERFLAEKYNKNDIEIFDHYTYALCGDGDLMEGVTSEASSLAGHLGLGKLIVLYDSNDISLDGETNISFSEDVMKKYEAYGWHVILVEDGTDPEAINNAIEEAKVVTDKPTLIEIKTVIGYGAPLQGTNKVHGAPLGEEGAIKAKEVYGWKHDAFHVPKDVYNHFNKEVNERGTEAYNVWEQKLNTYKEQYPEDYKELSKLFKKELTVNLDDVLPKYEQGSKEATRASSGKCINAIADVLPNFLGGSADLAGSNKTTINSDGMFGIDSFKDRNIYFGVREFSMACMLNGMSLHSGLRVFGSTFFVFSDYLKPAVRLSALMNQPVIYVLTHDSIAVGEDGPTHQPVEQLAMLRSIPNVQVIRPSDGNETAAAWNLALQTTDRPTVLVLTRQNVTNVTEPNFENMKKGAYILREATNKDQIDGILIASGSETELAINAKEALEAEGLSIRVVNMPCVNRFDEQSREYKEEVLPSDVRKRIFIEMGTEYGLYKYVGLDGTVMGVNTFGASGVGEQVIEEYGFTTDNVVKEFKKL